MFNLSRAFFEYDLIKLIIYMQYLEIEILSKVSLTIFSTNVNFMA